MLTRAFWLLIIPLMPMQLGSQETDRNKPAVIKTGEHEYRLGKIELNAKSREIRFPVLVNMREGGPIEYFLVHETGKVHESILVTPVSAFDLQVALKLLKYESGKGDLFNRMLPPHLVEEEGGTAAERGASVSFRFVPEMGEPIPAESTLIDGFEGKPLAEGEWIYTGSMIYEGSFMAGVEGSIIAIYLDPVAMFNSLAEGADNDERWGANSELVPEVGTRGHLIIRTH
ncbi:MAG: YdjY domain-containing protein [Verrucomicrobiota bacterium]